MKETRGQRIRRLRKSHGLTQQQLADKIGVSKGLISHWENDIVTQPQTDALFALAAALHTDHFYILFGEDRKPEPRTRAPVVPIRRKGKPGKG